MDEVYGPRSAMISAQAWEIGKLKAEVFRLQTALADATNRAEANATEVHILGERVRIECERRDQARRERDAATKRGEAAEGYIAKIEAIRGKKLGVPCCCDFADDDNETPIVECGYHRSVREERDAAIERAEDLKTAWRVANARADAAIARADALAARLAEEGK